MVGSKRSCFSDRPDSDPPRQMQIGDHPTWRYRISTERQSEKASREPASPLGISSQRASHWALQEYLHASSVLYDGCVTARRPYYSDRLHVSALTIPTQPCDHIISYVRVGVGHCGLLCDVSIKCALVCNVACLAGSQ